MTYDELANLFADNGYEWTFKDGKRSPSAREIEEVVLKTVPALNEDPEASQVEVGRLVIKKNGGYIDVFVHALEFRRDGL